jgi:hypothetical protein
VGSLASKLEFGSLIGGTLFPFGVSFLLPLFVVILVQEKEKRILVMMKINGVKVWAYYLSHYITFYTLYAVSTLLFVIAGGLIRLTLFTKTAPSVLFLMFFLWGIRCLIQGHNQISLAFFFATLFNKSRLALLATFLFVLCSVVISLATQDLFAVKQAPWLYLCWPPFAFYRALTLINISSYDPTFVVNFVNASHIE